MNNISSVPKIEDIFDDPIIADVNLLEIVRLTSLFPDANEFMYLYEPFPETFSGSEKMFALKLMNNYFKLLEERDVFGTIETDIIPIEYHSSFTLGLASNVKSFIEKCPDFFKVFFRDYDKIVIDSSEETSDRVFVIDDYAQGENILSYTSRDFLRIFLQKFDITEEEFGVVSPYILFGSDEKTTYNFYYSELLKIKSGNDLISTLCLNYDWENLYKFFSNRNKFDEIKNSYLREACFRELNTRVERLASRYPFIRDNIDLIYLAIIKSPEEKFSDFVKSMQRSSSSSNKSVSHEINAGVKYDKSDVFNLTRNILSKLDSTGKLSTGFDEALAKNDVILWHEDEKSVVVKELKNLFPSFQEKELCCTCCLSNSQTKKISVCSENIIADTLSLVHEFIHYYIANSGAYSLELSSVYFETRAADLLIESGFSEEEVKKNLNHRYGVDSLNNTFSHLKPFVDLLYKKKKFGSIDLENIRSEKEIEVTNSINHFWNGFFESLEKEADCDNSDFSMFVTKDKDNLEYAGALLEALKYFPNYETLVSYSVGSFLGKNRSEEIDQIMLHYINHSEDITDHELYDSLTLCIKERKDISSSDHFQYVKNIPVTGCSANNGSSINS